MATPRSRLSVGLKIYRRRQAPSGDCHWHYIDEYSPGYRYRCPTGIVVILLCGVIQDIIDEQRVRLVKI